MQVLHIQLNAHGECLVSDVGMHIKLNVHNEEFVFDASIAFLITCTQ
jgi:hypothetical protein